MRKIISHLNVSLDGFGARPDGAMDWIAMGEDIFGDAVALTDTADTALYGRVTYHLMEDYWPVVLKNPQSTKMEHRFAQWSEDVTKFVISNTLKATSWNRSSIMSGDITGQVNQLKSQVGRDIIIFGSPYLTKTLTVAGLIDEFIINVNPVIIGKGITVFPDGGHDTSLKLLNTKTYGSGVIALHYGKK